MSVAARALFGFIRERQRLERAVGKRNIVTRETDALCRAVASTLIGAGL